MNTVQPTGILHQYTLPGDWHSQKEGIEPGVVESFADVASGGQQNSLLTIRFGKSSAQQMPLGIRAVERRRFCFL